MPAFTPENCGREDEAGNHMAKSSAAMDKLRDLHKNSSSSGSSGNGGAYDMKSIVVGAVVGAAAAVAFLKYGPK